MSYIESKSLYKELILVMENCEELSIPWGNVSGLCIEPEQENGISDYSLTFVLDGSCSLYMMHPDNGVDSDPSAILKRLFKWKDVTHLVLVDHEGKQRVDYVSSWESMGVNNDQEHRGQDVEIEVREGFYYVRMTCKSVPSGLNKE